MSFRVALTILLLLMMPGGFLTGTLASYGYLRLASMIPVAMAMFLVISMAFAYFRLHKISFTRLQVYFLLFYLVYHAYTFYYILIAPEMPRFVMADVPPTTSLLYRDFFIQTVAVLLVGFFRKYIDFKLFARVTSITVAILFFFYYSQVGFASYGIEDIADIKLLSGEIFIVSFRLARYFALAFFCCIACRSSWFKLKFLNLTLTYVLSAILFIGLILTVKRGPILSIFVTFIYWYIIKSKAKHVLRSFLLSVLLILFFGNMFADFVETYMAGLAERIEMTIEGGGSGRFGSSKGVFNVARKQIEDGVFFGSYFRLKNAFWFGTYPHNFILEMLMTFGVVISAVFIPLFWKIFKYINVLIKQNSSITLSATCFLYIFCALMTSGSVFLNTEFWIFLSIICSYRMTYRKKRLKFKRNINE